MMDEYPTVSGLGVAGLVLVSLLYIPNAIVSTAAVVVGSEFSIGEGSVSLFSAHLVPLPPLPITGGIPASAPSWAVVLLVVPLGAAIYALYKKRPSFQDVLVATVASAVVMFIACYLVSGDLGYYGATGPILWTAAGLTALWMAVVGSAVAAGFAFVAWRAARTARVTETDETPVEPEREPITDPEIVDAEVVENEPDDSAPDAAADGEEGTPAEDAAKQQEEPEESEKHEESDEPEDAEEKKRGVAKPVSQQLKDQMGESEQASSSENSSAEGERD